MSRTIKAGTEKCSICKKVAELRPYGPGGAFICFDCGEKDKVGTEAEMTKLMTGDVVLDLTDQGGTPRLTGTIE